jgi:hypothetical protein
MDLFRYRVRFGTQGETLVALLEVKNFSVVPNFQ